MSLGLVYGNQLESTYLDAGETIASEVTQFHFFEVSKKINTTFFGGGPLAPKSFADLVSIAVPLSPIKSRHSPVDEKTYIEIRKENSMSGILGYVEVMPVIGSTVAFLNVIGHLCYMVSSYLTLTLAVGALNATERNEHNVGRGESCVKTDKVFDAAVSYTVHQNALVGSFLSLFPHVKPIVRLAQGITFHFSANPEPIENPEVIETT